MAFTRKDRSITESALIPEAIFPGKWNKAVAKLNGHQDAIVNVKKDKTLLIDPALYAGGDYSIRYPDKDKPAVYAELEKQRRRAFTKVRYEPRRNAYAGKLSNEAILVLEDVRMSALEQRAFGVEESFITKPEHIFYGSDVTAVYGLNATVDHIWSEPLPKFLVQELRDNEIDISLLYMLTSQDKRDGFTKAVDYAKQIGRYHHEWTHWEKETKPQLDSMLERVRNNPIQKTVIEVGNELDTLLGLAKSQKAGKSPDGEDSTDDGKEAQPSNFMNTTRRYFTSTKIEPGGSPEYIPGSYKTTWSKFAWAEPELTVDCKPPKGKQLSKQPRRKVSDMGYAPNRMERMLIDQRIFSPKLRKKAPTPVTLVVDCSGSMSPNYEAITELIDRAPTTQVVFYSGDTARDPKNSVGKAFIAAKDGKRITPKQAKNEFYNYGNNDMDMPILQWAVAQPGKVVWISDGASYCIPAGNFYKYDNGSAGVDEVAAFIKHHDIPRYHDIQDYIDNELGARVD